MQTYDIGLVPGPVSVPPELSAVFQINYGSSDLFRASCLGFRIS
jgi:hypothetical protein